MSKGLRSKMADPSCPHYERYEIQEIGIIRNRCNVEYDAFLDIYAVCNHDNYPNCPRYLGHRELSDRLEEEREEIVGFMPQSD